MSINKNIDESIYEQIKNINSIFDTHAHYNDPKFSNNQQEIINYVHNQGISNICNMSADLEECETSIELAQKFSFIFCAVGIHPENVENLETDWLIKLENFAKQKKVVAIGEIGLDYHYENFDKDKQIEVFEKQMGLAKKLKLPVVIHSRDATLDTTKILEKFPETKGVVHCFSGSTQTALNYISMGYFIGFTGIITFKNSKQLKETAKNIPLENIVIETDCPFLAPEPWRGQICNSAMLISVVKTLAEIKETSIEKIIKVTNENAFRLYKIK